MGKKDNERDRLEELCTRCAALGPEDEAARADLQERIFELVFRLFPKKEDEIIEVFMGDWQHFDPAQSTAYNFFSSRIAFRRKDAYKKQKREQDRTVPDTVQTDDGEEGSRLANLPAGPGSDPEELLILDDTACELLTGILELRQRLQGRANNPVRRNYFRMFFTDNIVTYLHRGPMSEGLCRRERDVFAAMKEEFLDFFMGERCRTLPDICRSSLKLHGELVEGREMEETRLPLPGDVYVSYLGRVEHTEVGANTVSQQKTQYLQEVRKWLF